ncbi:MAG: DUF2062 domain-containing protein [Methylococcales bacterium]|nr:DUF2062 domain-containing protein [Methylococcales bacterium]
MPKQFIKKYLPNPETLKNHKNLQFLGDRLHEPNLWYLNRHAVAKAFAIGLFCAWIPTPGQMAIAAMIALYFRANLPISVVLVWLTNPLTMPPMFYFAYWIGLKLLNQPNPEDDFEFSVDGLLETLGDVWQPFLLGCLLLGIISSILGYFMVQGGWRYSISKKWSGRAKKRA